MSRKKRRARWYLDRLALLVVATLPFAWFAWEYEQVRRVSVTAMLVASHIEAIAAFANTRGRYPTPDEWRHLDGLRSRGYTDAWGGGLVYVRGHPASNQGAEAQSDRFAVVSFGSDGLPDVDDVSSYLRSEKDPWSTGGGRQDVVGVVIRDLRPG